MRGVRFCCGSVVRIVAISESRAGQRRQVFFTVVVMVLHGDIFLFLFDLNSLLLEATPPYVLTFLTIGRIRRTNFLLGLGLRVAWDVSTRIWGKGIIVCESGVR